MRAEEKNDGGKPVDCSKRLELEDGEVDKDEKTGLLRSTAEIGKKRGLFPVVRSEVLGNGNLVGNDFDNYLKGGTGEDTLTGHDGRDVLVAEGGNDKLNGGASDDALAAGDGNDNDVLKAGGGNDHLWGGEGADQLYGEADNDALHGQLGNDYLNGGSGDDNLSGDTSQSSSPEYYTLPQYHGRKVFESGVLRSTAKNSQKPRSFLIFGQVAELMYRLPENYFFGSKVA